MNNMYDRIEALCKDRGINMTQMCRDANIPRGNLTDLKNGRTEALATKNLAKIAVYFDVSIDYLLGNETKKAPSEENAMADILQEFRDNPDLRTLFSLSKNATVEELKQYINVIKALRGADE